MDQSNDYFKLADSLDHYRFWIIFMRVDDGNLILYKTTIFLLCERD